MKIFPNPKTANRVNTVFRIIRTDKVQYQQEYIKCKKKYCFCNNSTLGHGPYWYMYYLEMPRMNKYIGKKLNFINGKIKFEWINDEVIDEAMKKAEEKKELLFMKG